VSEGQRGRGAAAATSIGIPAPAWCLTFVCSVRPRCSSSVPSALVRPERTNKRNSVMKHNNSSVWPFLPLRFGQAPLTSPWRLQPRQYLFSKSWLPLTVAGASYVSSLSLFGQGCRAVACCRAALCLRAAFHVYVRCFSTPPPVGHACCAASHRGDLGVWPRIWVLVASAQ
jgi:hypothetical protein